MSFVYMKHEPPNDLRDHRRFAYRTGRRGQQRAFVWPCVAAMLSGAVFCTGSTLGEGTSATLEPEQRILRVCADPNNLPFSNDREEGFENRLARLIAGELGVNVTYTWWAQRRGFARNTLNAGRCDVIMGVPSSYEMGRTTRPYYRSSYVFVTRTADGLELDSLDDSRLRSLSIGVHVIGDDFSNVPPAHALAKRGIVDNVRGFSIYGDYSEPNPPRALIDALAREEIDIAIAWGPLAGYFAKKSNIPLHITRLAAAVDSGLPMAFDISMAVRQDDTDLLRRLDRAVAERRSDIDALLLEYGVPVMRDQGAPTFSEGEAR